jgi:hypothetical protein
VNGTWKLDYTLASGLNLVLNCNDGATVEHGVSGLYGLTGKVVGGQVELFATSYVLSDTDQTYLYGISDTLSATSASQVNGETFTTLEAAPADAEFQGVSLAPVPLPSTLLLLLSGLACWPGVILWRGTAPGCASHLDMRRRIQARFPRNAPRSPDRFC